MVTELPDRFVEKVMPVTECGCWIWMGCVDENGYGRFQASRKRQNLRAHRVAYEHLVGPIPSGLHLDHLCRVTSCVNPDHLEPVTNAENVQRGWNFKGKPAHCKNGHFVTKRIGTECAQCRWLREASPEFKANKNAASRARYWSRKNAS